MRVPGGDIEDAETYGIHARGIPSARGAEWSPWLYWAAPTPFNPAARTTGQPVAAVVNQGRWVVCCPAPGCGGAQLACLSDRRFMCVTCGNAANGGAWLPVLVPAARPGIAAALRVRADVRQQNWVPGQSVADLLAENTTLGDN